ncbi:MAG: galactose ABC transporter substrate-binding protein [Cellulosilyticaceae bacterium]
MQQKSKRLYGILGSTLLVGLGLITGVVALRPKDTPEEFKVGITIYDSEDAFIHNTKESIRRDLEILKVASGCSLTYEVADSMHDQKLQNEQVDTMIANGVDLLVINSVDRADAATLIDRAKKADVPIIFYNREPVPQDMQKWDKVYYVGSKAEEAGAIQGEILADALDNGLKVDTNQDGKIQYVMLEGEYGHQDAILRTYHCIRVLEERGYVMENLATDTGVWREDMGKAKMAQWYEQFGEQIEVVLANNDAMALGAMSLLEEKGYFTKGKWMPILGVDGISGAVAAIESGKMLGTVYNDWEAQASCIVRQIAELLGLPAQEIGESVTRSDRYFWVRHGKVTSENLGTVKNHTINLKK